jgi:hypothetical protein
MIAINFIFWVLVICVIAAISIPFIVLFIIGVHKRSRLIKWLGAVPAAGTLFLALCAFGLLFYGFMHPWSETTDEKSIRQSFKSNFDFEPDADFVPMHQKIYCLADNGCMHLEFRASQATFDKIRGLGFQAVSMPKFLSATGGSNAPDWWIKADGQTDDCFVNEKWKGSFSSNQAYLIYNPTSGVVYFFSEGID